MLHFAFLFPVLGPRGCACIASWYGRILCSLGLPSRLSDITAGKIIFNASIFDSFPGESNDYITKGIEKRGKRLSIISNFDCLDNKTEYAKKEKYSTLPS